MPVVFLIAIAVVLAGIVLAATGRGGELAYEHADHAPLDLGPVSAADVALLRPPTALWGYNMQVTDAALDQIAQAMRERDITIAYLQEQLASLEPTDSYAEPEGTHARQAPTSPYAPDFPAPPGAAGSVQEPETAPDPEIARDAEVAEVPWIFEFTEPAEDSEDSEARDAPEAAAVPETPAVPEAAQPQEAPAQPQEAPAQPQEAPAAAPRQQVAQAAGHPQTPLVLKASAVKAPPAPEPHEATQPNETLQQPHEATQPNQALQQGPQGSFDTYGWWAEQQQAEREERERDTRAGGGLGPAAPGDDPLAAAEEQAW